MGKLEGKSQLGRPSRKWVKIKPVMLNIHYSDEQIQKSKMGRALITMGRGKMRTGFGWET